MDSKLRALKPCFLTPAKYYGADQIKQHEVERLEQQRTALMCWESLQKTRPRKKTWA
jgi:hypothetical protein